MSVLRESVSEHVWKCPCASLGTPQSWLPPQAVPCPHHRGSDRALATRHVKFCLPGPRQTGPVRKRVVGIRLKRLLNMLLLCWINLIIYYMDWKNSINQRRFSCPNRLGKWKLIYPLSLMLFFPSICLQADALTQNNNKLSSNMIPQTVCSKCSPFK